MKFEVSQHGEFIVLHIKEDITLANSSFLDSLLEAKIRSHQNSIIVDLSEVHFIDSSGAAVFARNFNILKESEGMIILAGCNPFIRKLFTTIGFHKFFRITSTLEEALLK